jgi:hypothetical protein
MRGPLCEDTGWASRRPWRRQGAGRSRDREEIRCRRPNSCDQKLRLCFQFQPSHPYRASFLLEALHSLHHRSSAPCPALRLPADSNRRRSNMNEAQSCIVVRAINAFIANLTYDVDQWQVHDSRILSTPLHLGEAGRYKIP